MNTMKNPPSGDQGLAFQTHALQMNSLANFRFSMVWMYNNSTILISVLKFKARNSQRENMKTIPLGEIVIL